MTRGLIVSADDLGLHEAINRGVIRSHQEGIVTSASIVACGRAFEDACGLAKTHETLDLGIHLTLVEERPLLGPEVLKTLAPDGVFPKTYRHLFLDLATGRTDLAEIEMELDAQIQRVLNTGLTVTHLDSHQHTHFFPQLHPVLFRLAERYQIRRVRAGRRIVPARTKFSLLLAPFAKAVQRRARAHGLSTPDSLWLPSPSGRTSGAQLIENLQALPAGVTEVVMHPGSDQPTLDREYPSWAFDWEGELKAVTHRDLRDCLARHSIQLTRYSELE